MNDFVCPRCGGPYFGRDIGKDEHGPVPLPTVRCHCDINGRSMSTMPGEPKAAGPCGWRGEWPHAQPVTR